MIQELLLYVLKTIICLIGAFILTVVTGGRYLKSDIRAVHADKAFAVGLGVVILGIIGLCIYNNVHPWGI
jgi:hypothetical protein